uniref:Asp23/Gls24 family envelope stress response protein n=1 Tax=Methanomethylophilus alvi TaxID=1291540 RepID=UPI0037DCE4CF
MIRHENENGSVNVSTGVYTGIVGTAASNCFGVKGMAARSMKDDVYHLLRKESVDKGVRVTFNEDDSISIDLHIMVDKSVNLSAIASSIISEVRYFVTKSTGTQVRAVNVFVDSISVD